MWHSELGNKFKTFGDHCLMGSETDGRLVCERKRNTILRVIYMFRLNLSKRFFISVLPAVTYGSVTWALTKFLERNLRRAQRGMKR